MSLEALVIFFGACWFLVGFLAGFLIFRCINWSSVREWLRRQVTAK